MEPVHRSEETKEEREDEDMDQDLEQDETIIFTDDQSESSMSSNKENQPVPAKKTTTTNLIDPKVKETVVVNSQPVLAKKTTTTNEIAPQVKETINSANSLRALIAANKNTRKYRDSVSPTAATTNKPDSKKKNGLETNDRTKTKPEPIQSYNSLLCPKTVLKEIIDLNYENKELVNKPNHFTLVARASYDCTKVTLCEH
jgi:hypothetical protein